MTSNGSIGKKGDTIENQVSYYLVIGVRRRENGK